MNLYYLKSQGLDCQWAFDGYRSHIYGVFNFREPMWEKFCYHNAKPSQHAISMPGWKGCRQIKYTGSFYEKIFISGTCVNDIGPDTLIIRMDDRAVIGAEVTQFMGARRYVPVGVYYSSGALYQVLGTLRNLPGGSNFGSGGAKCFYNSLEEITLLYEKYGLLSNQSSPTWPGRYFNYYLHGNATSETGYMGHRKLNKLLASLTPPDPDPHSISLEDRNLLLDNAMVSFERLATMRIALEIMSDGLVMQAADSLTRMVSGFLSTNQGKQFLIRNGRLVESTVSKAKLAADSYMTYNWGIRAPLGDYSRLWSLLTHGDYYHQINNPFLVGRSDVTIPGWDRSNVVIGCQVNLSELDTIASTLYFLHKYGYTVTAADIWEVIPLSFAVDWLIDVSDWLDSLNRSFEYQNFPIRGKWLTIKSTKDLLIPGFSGTGTITYYNRGDMPTSFLPRRDEYKPIVDLTGRFHISHIGDAVALGTSFFLR